MSELEAYQDFDTIQKLLRTTKTVAVVGLSANVLRASYFVGFYLQRHGYRVIPVNPRLDEVLGEKAYPDLTSVPHTIDIVNVFRAPDAVPAIVDEALSTGAKGLWLQFGVIHTSAAEKARASGMDVVMDRCIKVEHARTLGRMHWLGFNTSQVTARRGGLQ